MMMVFEMMIDNVDDRVIDSTMDDGIDRDDSLCYPSLPGLLYIAMKEQHFTSTEIYSLEISKVDKLSNLESLVHC